MAVPVKRTSSVDWVGVLAGADYYEAVPKVFASARRSIDLCMFHIAYPNEAHPTRRLLRALQDAKKRGVRVRVMIDRDRPSDPYKSTVINTAAKKALEKAGIAVRFDKADRLLHSKYFTVDGELCVIGSHNWSAGSYFEFDDLTLVLASRELARELTTRFNRLWRG